MSVERVCRRPNSEIGRAIPIAAIVQRTLSLTTKIGNLVLLEAMFQTPRKQ